MNLSTPALGTLMLSLLLGSNSQGFAQAPAQQSASQNPPVVAGTTNVPNAPRRGGPRGGPITPEEQAQIAKMFEFPALTPGSDEGDFSHGPMYTNAPELTPRDNVPKGKVVKFVMNDAESKFYPPTGLRGTTTNRSVTVYIPSQYVPGTPAPVLVTHDAMGSRNNQLPTILDNLIADKKVPAMVAVMLMHGGGDGGGSERGLEYDTVSGKYAEFIEAEVLTRIEKDYGVTFSKDPEARATMGGSSGGAVALSMAWFHPEWYHRVLTYSGTYVNQQTPRNPETPHGAWEYHEHLIPSTPVKPLRIWMQVGQNDNQSMSSEAGLHNWVMANQRMAAVLKAKGYHYQFVFSKGAGHVDRNAVNETLPQALVWLWKGYPTK